MGTGKLKSASAEDIRNELRDLLQLFSLKLEFFVETPEISRAIDMSAELAGLHESSSDEVILKNGVKLVSSMQELKRSVLNELDFKRSWRAVCAEFRAKVASKEFDPVGEGVPLSWLHDNFGKMARSEAARDLPLHARMGFGPNRRRVGTEEQTLLSDAFMFLRNADRLLKKLTDLVGEERRKGTRYENAPTAMRDLTLGICANARSSLFTFCSFAECFVNGVGLDYVLRHPGIEADKLATLKGVTLKGSYLSLEAKIEKFPQIIRPASGPVIVLRDPKQVREPFKTFLEIAKPTRDSIAHHADGKARIWFGPTDWIDLANKAAAATINSCREFWSACYPGRKFPLYLAELDFQKLCERADAQVTAQA